MSDDLTPIEIRACAVIVRCAGHRQAQAAGVHQRVAGEDHAGDLIFYATPDGSTLRIMVRDDRYRRRGAAISME